MNRFAMMVPDRQVALLQKVTARESRFKGKDHCIVVNGAIYEKKEAL